MSAPVNLKDPGITLDGVAGSELVRLEAWVLEWFRQFASPMFKTVDRWSGRFREEGAARKAFGTPALFITVPQNRGTASTRGGVLAIDVELAGVIVADNKAKSGLMQAKERYNNALLAASAMFRYLFVMDPADPQQCDESSPGSAPRDLWSRPDNIQMQNIYSEKWDKMGQSVFEFRWTHRLHVADVNLNCLEDLHSIFGSSYPNDEASENVPVTGEVDFTA